jgi:hypothetical protein
MQPAPCLFARPHHNTRFVLTFTRWVSPRARARVKMFRKLSRARAPFACGNVARVHGLSAGRARPDRTARAAFQPLLLIPVRAGGRDIRGEPHLFFKIDLDGYRGGDRV